MSVNVYRGSKGDTGLTRLLSLPKIFFVSSFGFAADSVDAGVVDFLLSLSFFKVTEEPWRETPDDEPGWRVDSPEWASDGVVELRVLWSSSSPVLSPLSEAGSGVTALDVGAEGGADVSLSDVSALTRILRACSRISSVRIASAWTTWRVYKHKTHWGIVQISKESRARTPTNR